MKSTTYKVYQCENCDHEKFFEGLDAEGVDHCEECGGDLVFSHVDNVVEDSTASSTWPKRTN